MAGDPEQICLEQPLEVDGETVMVSCVSMGNPHLMLFGDIWDVDKMAVMGSKIEHHPWFPHRINVHSVEVVDSGHLRMRHWERGAGLTLACGTGVAAATAAAAATRRAKRAVRVDVPGGQLDAVWDEETNAVFLTGPAVEVCQGTFALR